MNRTDAPIVVGIGEALFDCLPDAVKLGGAPINLAVHAHQMLAPVGGSGVPVACVGADELGDRIIEELSSRGLDASWVQRDPDHPTGRVRVHLDKAGHAEYVIEEGAAWDHLRFDDALAALAGRCAAVAFGSLAQRSITSRESIRAFLKAAPRAMRLFDVNLRQAYFSEEVLADGFGLATAAKLNDEELPRVCAVLGITAGATDADGQARALRERFGLDVIAITRGARGTLLYDARTRVEGAPVQIDPAAGADSVGAGDACCAGLICGLLLGRPLQEVADLANEAGAFVATRAGATPTLPGRLLERLLAMPETKGVPLEQIQKKLGIA